MTPLAPLFKALAGALDGDLEIEREGRKALLDAADSALVNAAQCQPIPSEITSVMQADDALACCAAILENPIPWKIPETASTPEYFEVSQKKIIAELVGPDGLVKQDGIRVGVYGILPGVDYGIRTHPAEEIFVLVAGRSDWLSGNETELKEYGPGTRRHHHSMMPHATRTRDTALCPSISGSAMCLTKIMNIPVEPEEKIHEITRTSSRHWWRCCWLFGPLSSNKSRVERRCTA